MLHSFAVALVALLVGCLPGDGDDIGNAPDPSTDSETADDPAAIDDTDADPEAATSGILIEVDLRPECAGLAELDAPPDDLTVGGFFACLTDETFARLDAGYRRKHAGEPGATGATGLAEAILAIDTMPIGEVIAQRALSSRPAFEAVLPSAGTPTDPLAAVPATTGPYGIAGTDCAKSCLTASVPVVGTTRSIAHSSSFNKGGWNPGDTGDTNWFLGRHLDETNYGTVPNLRQGDLASSELRSAGCGPVAAINLFEWWNIPVYDGSRRLTSFDDRVDFMADCMGTLDGANYTDDDALFSCVANHPVRMYNAGRISGYPGYHYSRDNARVWKALVSYVSQGHPVIALYSTSSSALHWALITGYKDGKLIIANATDRTLGDFYNQWNDWASLGWIENAAAGMSVDYNTMIAYTGWSSTTPAAFVARTSGSRLPGYNAGGAVRSFRYCTAWEGEIAEQAERLAYSGWPSEPDYPDENYRFYCLFNGSEPALTLTKVSNYGVQLSTSLRSFIANNPGVRGQWWGRATDGTWASVSSPIQLRDVTSNIMFTGSRAGLTGLQFWVHSPDVANAYWAL